MISCQNITWRNDLQQKIVIVHFSGNDDLAQQLRNIRASQLGSGTKRKKKKKKKEESL